MFPTAPPEAKRLCGEAVVAAVTSADLYPAPVENFERAREAVAEWPAWKREHTLTKHSEGVALQAPAKGVGTTDTLQATTMSSREIAELTGKRHDNVLADIRVMLAELPDSGGVLSFQGTYIHPQNGQKYVEYHLPKDLTITLVSGYSIPMRHRIVTRWMELEESAKPVQQAPVAVSKDPLDLLMIQAQMFPQLIAEMQEQKRVSEGQARALEAQGHVIAAQAEELEAPNHTTKPLTTSSDL